MFGLLVRRLVAAIPVIFIVSVGVFLLQSLVPGDPAVEVAGEFATPEQIDEVRAELNLDKPLVVQYGKWASSAVRGDLGSSVFSDSSVSGQIRDRVPVTLSIVLAGVVVAVLIGLPMGALAGVFPNSWFDRASRLVSSLGISIPNFVLAILLVIVFSVQLKWLPSLGFTPITENPVGWLEHALLPAVTLGLFLTAIFSRQLRASLTDVMSSNYVRAAWARGASRSLVVRKHGLKNSLIPAVTVLGVQMGALLGGSVIVEQIFSIPGMGPYVLEAIRRRDFPVIQGVALFFAVVQLSIGFILDLAYGFLNPKVRVS